jgi:flavin-binding protein dodecin
VRRVQKPSAIVFMPIVNVRGDVVVNGMPIHKEVTITATSPDSWEDAALNAVQRTETSVEHLQWAVVQDQSIELGSPGDHQFKTKVKIGFAVDE